mgnify:CR=1 FL=1
MSVVFCCACNLGNWRLYDTWLYFSECLFHSGRESVMGHSCCYKPQHIGESAETGRLRAKFDRLVASVRHRPLESFDKDDVKDVMEFRSGERNPPITRTGESVTQRLLREGIEKMEELLSYWASISYLVPHHRRDHMIAPWLFSHLRHFLFSLSRVLGFLRML